jgi:hypothetical protein
LGGEAEADLVVVKHSKGPARADEEWPYTLSGLALFPTWLAIPSAVICFMFAAIPGGTVTFSLAAGFAAGLAVVFYSVTFLVGWLGLIPAVLRRLRPGGRPEAEQGPWAGEVPLGRLGGRAVSEMPIISPFHRSMWPPYMSPGSSRCRRPLVAQLGDPAAHQSGRAVPPPTRIPPPRAPRIRMPCAMASRTIAPAAARATGLSMDTRLDPPDLS